MSKIKEEPKKELTILNRDAIRNKKDVQIKRLEIPEWDGVVYIRSISGRERDDIECIFADENQELSEKLRNMRARMAVLSVCDNEGNRLFTLQDMEWLGEKNANALNKIFTEARALSGFSKSDIKELEGNSSSSQS
jgi:hypothetical protein